MIKKTLLIDVDGIINAIPKEFCNEKDLRVFNEHHFTTMIASIKNHVTPHRTISISVDLKVINRLRNILKEYKKVLQPIWFTDWLDDAYQISDVFSLPIYDHIGKYEDISYKIPGYWWKNDVLKNFMKNKKSDERVFFFDDNIEYIDKNILKEYSNLLVSNGEPNSQNSHIIALTQKGLDELETWIKA